MSRTQTRIALAIGLVAVLFVGGADGENAQNPKLVEPVEPVAQYETWDEWADAIEARARTLEARVRALELADKKIRQRLAYFNRKKDVDEAIRRQQSFDVSALWAELAKLQRLSKKSRRVRRSPRGAPFTTVMPNTGDSGVARAIRDASIQRSFDASNARADAGFRAISAASAAAQRQLQEDSRRSLDAMGD